ncbi:cell division protein FtsQ/DivIB [Patescibacteria group bacterium]
MWGSKRKIQKRKAFKRRRPVTRTNTKAAFRHTRQEFKKTHPEVQKSYKRLFYLIGILFIIGFISYFLVFSNFLKITDIKIVNDITQDEILEQKMKEQLNNLIGENLFLLATDDIEKKLKTKFKELEGVEVGKNYPDTLEIEYQEYPLVANIIYEYDNVEIRYIINSIGYPIKEKMESPNLPYIRVKSNEPVNPNKAILEANKLRYILETSVYFKDKFGMRLIEVEYKPIPRELHLLTEKEFYIWLDVQEPFEDQLKKLKKALIKLDIYNQQLEYIDLRITGTNGDKIIYK